MDMPSIELPALAFDIAWHPAARILAAGTITGEVLVYGIETESHTELFQASFHTDSCRQVAFAPDGVLLYSTGTDRGIQATDVGTGKAVGTMVGAHSAAINALHVIDAAVLATGDDEGVVKVWDIRSQQCVAEYDEHADYIAQLTTTEHHAELLAASGDGTLSIMDWRSKDIELSYQLEDEPLCLTVIKGGSRVVCGTQEGTMGLYTWGKWEDVSDRMVGHPASVDCVVKLGEDTVATGSSDGMVRLVDIMPHRIRGVLGEHDGFPVEALALSGDGELLASCSHDQAIKFWNVKGLGDSSASAKPAGGFFDDL
eukprot:m.122323 g.122323  ORF g.122323 m.122323 type:complete len:313 (-) comp11103_c0_seq4:147-1085(-)